MNPNSTYKLGTRGSPLALWQAERVKRLLYEACPDVRIEIVKIQTTGDKILDKPLVQVGDKGIFTKEIEIALLDEEIDFAVHSFKDLPTQQPDGLTIVSIPEREAPFDALFSRSASTLKDLPESPVLATGSIRRKAQVLAARPDATVVDLRGNVNTRLRKYEESDWDGMLMALAGVRRMKWEDKIAGVLSLEEMLPAPAQGALVIEARVDDEETHELVESIIDPVTAQTVLAERAFLTRLEGGCQVPMAAYATLDDDLLTLEGLIARLDGTRLIRETVRGSVRDSVYLGISLAESILEKGGSEIIAELVTS